MDIASFLSRSATRHPGRTAAVDGRRSLTYAELDERVGRLASGLLGLGLRPGDRVVDLQHNALEYLETDLAMARAGLVRVAVNTRLQLADWSFIAADCGARGLVYGGGYAEVAAELADGVDGLDVLLGVPDGPGRRYEDVVAAGAHWRPGRRPAPDDLVSLNYSSGTTGRPKGCMRSHRNRFASMRDILVSLMEQPLGPDDVWLHAGPMTHASGLFVFPHVVAGATQVILPRFDPELALRAVTEHAVTGTVWVPTMVERVLAAPGLARTDLGSLRRVTYAGAPMAPDRIRAAAAALGGRLTQFYGMVEAIPPLAVLTQADHAAALAGDRPERLASAGRAVLGCDLAVLDEEGHPAAPGEVGDLVVSGDHVMAGYWGRPDETGKALADGELRTGDLAWTDEQGCVTIVDRRSDMIIRGGYNVYPREVEDVIAELPAVEEVAVIGVPDVEWGQVVAAYVVARPGTTVDPEDVAGHCRVRLAGFKLPRRVEVTAALPRSSTGKISRTLLRRQLSEQGG